MFLLVSGRHVGAHTDGHQRGVSIQISINMGKKFLRISRIRKIAVTRILARVFAYLPSFISQILDFIYWPVLIFILIFSELRDTENQQFLSVLQCNRKLKRPWRDDRKSNDDSWGVTVAWRYVVFNFPFNFHALPHERTTFGVLVTLEKAKLQEIWKTGETKRR